MVKLKLFLASTLSILLFGPLSQAASSGGGFGVNVGSGLPFLTQAGINYMPSQRFSFNVGYNSLSVDVGLSKAELTMPEFDIYFHPFSGAFFIGVGAGQESLTINSSDITGSASVKLDVKAMTTVAKLGWMWGADNGGFWFGVDASYIIPSGAKTTITTSGSIATTDQAYLDALDASDKFGETAYINITFARLGWLF